MTDNSGDIRGVQNEGNSGDMLGVQNEGNSGDMLGVQNEGNWSEECRLKHGQPSSANDRPTIKLHS